MSQCFKFVLVKYVLQFLHFPASLGIVCKNETVSFSFHTLKSLVEHIKCGKSADLVSNNKIMSNKRVNGHETEVSSHVLVTCRWSHSAECARLEMNSD